MKKSVMLAICVAGLSVTFATSAFAESECTTNADCEGGWECEEIGGYETCSATTDGEEPVCESTSEFACVPPPPPMCDPAQSSSDCGGDDVCVTFTYESCTSTGGGSVDPSNGDGSTGSGGDDEPPRCDTGEPDGGDGERCDGGDPSDETSCDEQTESYCVPPYIAPCSADADCGSGFTCEDVVVCEPCAVDVGTPGGPDGEGSDGGDDSCESSCAPTGQKYCAIVEVECTSDADCGEGFECELYDAPIATDCAVDPDGGDEDCVSEEPEATSGYCAPEGWGYWGGGYDEDGGTSGGAPNAPGGQGWDLSDAEAARAGDADAGQDDDSDGSTSGCTTTRSAAPVGGGLGLLAMLLGLVGVRTRRRD